jgi:hypothetical protein
MRAITILLAVSIASAADAPPKLDRINLSNGRALVGTIASETNDLYMVTLPGGNGGVMQVAKSRVVSVERGAEDAPVVQLASAPTQAEMDAAKAIRQQPKADKERRVEPELDPLAFFTDRAVVKKFGKGWVWVDAGAWMEMDRDRKSKLIAQGAKIYGDTIEIHSFADDRLLAWGDEGGAELSGMKRRFSTSGGFSSAGAGQW